MKKIILTYGAIAGLIVSFWMVVTMALGCEQIDNNWGMVLGFTGMIIGFAFIFVAVKKYRDQYRSGHISFGSAFKIGLLISIIASTFYVISWLIDYYFFIPDFMEKYSANVIRNLQESGATLAQIEQKRAEMASMASLYKNPFFVVLITYSEILPVGLLISLIAAAILRKKPTQMANGAPNL